MAILNPQNTFVTNFNADGQEEGIELMTDERGHMFPVSQLFNGEVLNGTFQVTPPIDLSMSVLITKGYAQIKSTGVHTDFCYLAWMASDLQLALAPASTSGNRYSAIVAYIDTAIQYEESVTNNPGLLVIKEIVGATSGTPTELTENQIKADPSIGNKPFIVLGQIYIPAGAQTISAGNIIDKRKSITLGRGVDLPEGSFASGIKQHTSSSYKNNLQIAVINYNDPVPNSTSGDLLVLRLAN